MSICVASNEMQIETVRGRKINYDDSIQDIHRCEFNAF